jgi:hypothetical protein
MVVTVPYNSLQACEGDRPAVERRLAETFTKCVPFPIHWIKRSPVFIANDKVKP